MTIKLRLAIKHLFLNKCIIHLLGPLNGEKWGLINNACVCIYMMYMKVCVCLCTCEFYGCTESPNNQNHEIIESNIQTIRGCNYQIIW